jgi:DNA-binding GntR family transcriptional regulator
LSPTGSSPANVSEDGVPLYLKVARSLEQAIVSGVHPVGSLIPTEVELAASFGVSRQTVRQAIASLRQQKLLSALKGVGTRVEAAQPQKAYYHALQSLPELFQYAEHAAFHALETERIAAVGRLATELNCRAGRRWIRLAGPRVEPDGRAPLCWMTVYVDDRFSALVDEPRTHTTAIFSQIEKRYGEAIIEVRQDIEAVLLDQDDAKRLAIKPRTAALLITRRYYTPGHRLIELSKSLHPASRFRYAMTLRRE